MVNIEIVRELLQIGNSVNSANSFVGAGYVTEDAGPEGHAVLVIKHDGISRLFHYTGKEVLLHSMDEVEVTYFKSLDFIDDDLVPAFLAHCEMIEENATPKFCYFYDSRSIYDTQGNYKNPQDFPEYMTCVGFCLNIVNDYLTGESFLFQQDWGQSTIPDSKEYIEKFIKTIKKYYPSVDIDNFVKEMRRILPIEYLAASFSETNPVRRDFIEKIAPVLKSIIDKQQEKVN